MLKNFLITNIRNLVKNRSHAIINILGLSLGITSAVLIFLILNFELGFDHYHPAKDRIYRVATEFKGSEKTGYSSAMTYPLPDALRKDFPDPELVALVDANMSDPVITITKPDGSIEKFKETKAAFVDPEYLKIFYYDWIEGNSDALLQEKSVVLCATLAKKYFGTERAVGKVINFNNEFDVTVTGVVADPPLQTDFPFQMILSLKLGANKRGWEDWGASSSALNCYLRLNSSVTQQDFEAKLKGWHLKYFTGDNEDDGKARTYFLQPLSELHFDSRFGSYGGRVVSYATLLTLGFIGILLLLTACINFINLNTALIINRSKEAGIRKVMGSTRSQLVFQFLGETFLIALVSLLLSIVFVELAIVKLVPELGYTLAFNPLSDLNTLFFLIALPILISLLAGLYPGISLSRFQPAATLKSRFSGNPNEGFTLRRGLIVLQLMIAQGLVVSTIIVVQQINYFTSQPLGLNSEAVIEFELPENEPELIQLLRERLKNIPGVENVTMSNTGSTSGNTWGGDFTATINDEPIKENAQIKFVDENFVNTYQLQLLSGEDLVRSDTATRFLVNESFAKKLGFENTGDAIGTHIDVWGRKAYVSGIVKDFNSNSLHRKLGPVIMMCDTRSFYQGAVRLRTGDMRKTLAEIQKTWEAVYPKYVYEYTFLDETIAKFYSAEKRSSKLIGTFAGVAILIGCIGLFGLVSFMARKKTKEVGIRKTLGASVAQVVGLFSREFVLLIAVSFALSAPVAYYFIEKWLDNFAYRIQPGIGTFTIGLVVMAVVVLATVGIRSYQAAVANPIDALRDE